MWTDGMGSWMFFGGFWMLLFWGGLIALIIWGITRLSQRESSPNQKQDALNIARERYAKGEIGKEEFEQLKKDLS